MLPVSTSNHSTTTYAFEVPSPLGALNLTASAAGSLRSLHWPGASPTENTLWLGDAPTPAAVATVAEAATEQLTQYFAGRRKAFDLSIELIGTAFQVSAWKTLQTIPYGKTATYGEQAARMNKPSASRAVGAANGRNPLAIVVPCHRVIGASGNLTGFAGGLDTKAWLLNLEQGHDE